MLHQFIENIKKVNLNKGNSVLIAVSGGVDSVVLTHLASQFFDKVFLAHCNFQLRGEESNRDESFITQLAAEYQLPLYKVRWDTNAFAEEKNISIQEAARALRYQWFHEILEGIHPHSMKESFVSTPPEFILTAHHSDDQLETFFIHLTRGSGLRGLKGILPKNNRIVRPMLNISKQEILDYAKQHQLDFVEDSSNESDKYTRNFFRLKILPLIEERFPHFSESMLRNIQDLQGGFELYDLKLRELMKNLVVEKNEELHIPIRKLKLLPAYETILWEIIQKYGFSAAQLKDILSLTTAQTGKFVSSETYQIFKHREWLIITKKLSDQVEHCVVDELGMHETPIGNFEISISSFNGITESNTDIAQFDADKIEFPLIIRKWREGDYFYPLGMRKKKKVSRFCIDQKLSKSEKEKIWVLEMNNKIIWVIGKRIDDRFKLSPNTNTVLQFVIKNY